MSCHGVVILILAVGCLHVEPRLTQAAELAEVLSPVLEQVVRSNIPRDFRDESDWGKSKEFTRRVKIRGKWFEPRLERIKKEKEHGDWIRYVGTIEDPQRDVQVWVEGLSVTAARTQCQVHARVHFTGETEFQQWVRGTRLLGVTISADCVVHLRLDVTLDTNWSPAGLLSSAEIRPTVTGGAIDLESFYIHRIGKAHGEVAEQIGERLEGTLREKLARRADKLVAFANKALVKELEDGAFELNLLDFVRERLPGS